MSKFKVGAEVHIIDRAWGKVVNTSPDDCHICANDQSGKLRTFRVVAVDVRVPVYLTAFGNTLIIDTHSGTMFVLNDCNLYKPQSIGLRFFANGKDVTGSLSQQSKQAVLQAHTR